MSNYQKKKKATQTNPKQTTNLPQKQKKKQNLSTQ